MAAVGQKLDFERISSDLKFLTGMQDQLREGCKKINDLRVKYLERSVVVDDLKRRMGENKSQLDAQFAQADSALKSAASEAMHHMKHAKGGDLKPLEDFSLHSEQENLTRCKKDLEATIEESYLIMTLLRAEIKNQEEVKAELERIENGLIQAITEVSRRRPRS